MTDYSSQDSVPTHKELFNPVLRAIHGLGGSASNAEIVDRVIEDMRLPDNDRVEQGDPVPNLDFRGVYSTIIEDWLRLDAKPIVGGTFEKPRFLN